MGEKRMKSNYQLRIFDVIARKLFLALQKSTK